MVKRATVDTEFSCLSQTRNVRAIGERVRVLCDRSGVDPGVAEDVVIAIDEAVTNIMLHGYAGREDGEIKVGCAIDGTRISIRLRDRGIRYRLPELGCLLERKRGCELEKGGYGLILMRKFMDEIDVSFDEAAGENTLVMKKYIRT